MRLADIYRTIAAGLAIAAIAASLGPDNARASSAACLGTAVQASGLAPGEPLAAYKARANWDAEVSLKLGGRWSRWGAAEGAIVTCGKARSGGHFCIANAKPCRFAGS